MTKPKKSQKKKPDRPVIMEIRPVSGVDSYDVAWYRRKIRGYGMIIIKKQRIDGMILAFSCRECLRTRMRLVMLSVKLKKCPVCGWKPDARPRREIIEDILIGDKP
uniref:Uncharacterized protein n=1 Tax=viral metagenome TaxID=1070528 RepID=A0A6M3IZ40_9ZZZZ